MNNITSFFDKNKRELSNNSDDGQDSKKQREASSLELTFEKALDGDVFKDCLKSEDRILVLKRCMENTEKKMEELCIATKNTKESNIKIELQLISMKETINFIGEKFDGHEKDEIIKSLSKKTSEMAQRIDTLVNLIDRQEQYLRRNCILVHGILGTNDENTDDLVLKTINDKLDVNITEGEIDRSHGIDTKKDGRRPRPIIVKLMSYNTREKVFAGKRKLKGTRVSITENLTAKRMEQLNKTRE